MSTFFYLMACDKTTLTTMTIITQAMIVQTLSWQEMGY